MITIQQESEPRKRREAVAMVLAELPEWFGLPESTQEYIDEAAHLPLWVAQSGATVVGFIDLNETSPMTGEISCMGIRKAYQRQGIGRQLVTTLKTVAREKYQFLQVKTVAPGHYPQYDETIAFYTAMGFAPLEVFPTLWDAWNPCLIMIQSLKSR
ncbi:GNAT family N-acetyltransferase [Lacticaseibacillus daqingensis]|uniref:GNAT family N-acetyltransferase n=1 Tax=Lacticaseibacillus daqingensis TaxID=2486014 RepID=UPI000F795FF9|nr:GNAT family N-acetyltransferase [Lacticaseibacillus daqingensis]